MRPNRNLHLLLWGLSAVLLVQCQSRTTVVETSDKQQTKILQLTKRWETEPVLKTPESVIFDALLGLYYVACIGEVPPDAKDGDGYIARIDQRGRLIDEAKWVTGLHGPKGMAIRDSLLYVADVDELVTIHTGRGEIVNRRKIAGAQFLNDVAITAEGVIYISDSNTNTIHEVKGNGQRVALQDTSLGRANGIFVDGDKLILAGSTSGNISLWKPGAESLDVKVGGIARADGIERIGEFLLVSSWSGEVWQIDSNWEKHLLLDTKAEEINAADITVVPNHNLLLIPTFFHNTVAAYEITGH